MQGVVGAQVSGHPMAHRSEGAAVSGSDAHVKHHTQSEDVGHISVAANIDHNTTTSSKKEDAHERHEGAAVTGSEETHAGKKRAREESVYPQATLSKMRLNSLEITPVNEDSAFFDQQFYDDLKNLVGKEVHRLQRQANGEKSLEGGQIAARLAKKALKVAVYGTLSLFVTPVGALAIKAGVETGGKAYDMHKTHQLKRRASGTLESMDEPELETLLGGNDHERLTEVMVMNFFDTYGPELRQLDPEAKPKMAQKFVKAMFSTEGQKELSATKGDELLETITVARKIRRVLNDAGIHNPDWDNMATHYKDLSLIA